jgi:hypothetical protein
VNGWAAHNHKLDARFEIQQNRFILLTVNQEEVHASGCSIDDLYRFIQDLDLKYNLGILDRRQMAFINKNGEIQVCGLDDISSLYQDKILLDDTYIFNNTIQDASLLNSEWKIPFKKSGFAAFV